MTKSSFISYLKYFLLLLCFATSAYSHDHIPENEDELGLYGNVRLFQKYKKLNFLFEYQKSIETENLEPQLFRFGGKYRLAKSFKLGLYFKRVSNQRYDDDWVLVDGEWEWLDSKGRKENHFLLEGSFRSKLKRSLVFEFRGTFELNNFNDQQTLKVRPGLTFFNLNSDWLKHSIFLQYEANLPINYSEKMVSQHWIYLGGTLFLFKIFKFWAIFRL